MARRGCKSLEGGAREVLARASTLCLQLPHQSKVLALNYVSKANGVMHFLLYSRFPVGIDLLRFVWEMTPCLKRRMHGKEIMSILYFFIKFR